MDKSMNFRSRVMKTAWQIWKATNGAWSECMKKAWRVYKLSVAMRKGVVTFMYKKLDGSLRAAYGTLMNIASHKPRKKKQTFATMTYFDVVKRQFRSFRVENLIGPYCENTQI